MLRKGYLNQSVVLEKHLPRPLD